MKVVNPNQLTEEQAKALLMELLDKLGYEAHVTESGEERPKARLVDKRGYDAISASPYDWY